MKKVKCPKFGCHSKNCIPLAQSKNYSASKGLIGGAIGMMAIGPLGGLVGGATGLNGKKKVKMMCQDCGAIFEIKL